MDVLLNVFTHPKEADRRVEDVQAVHEPEHDDETPSKGRKPGPQTPKPKSVGEPLRSTPYGVMFQVPLNDSTVKGNATSTPNKAREYVEDDNTTVSTMGDLSMHGASVARSLPPLSRIRSRKRSNSVDSTLERSLASLPTTALHHQLEQSLDLESSSSHQFMGLQLEKSTSGISLSSWLNREQEWRTGGGTSAFRPISPFSFGSPSPIFSPPSPNTPSLVAPSPNLPVARLNFAGEDYKQGWHSSQTKQPSDLHDLNTSLNSLQKHHRLATERNDANRERIGQLEQQRAELQKQNHDLKRSAQHPPKEIITGKAPTPVKSNVGLDISPPKGLVPDASELEEELDLAKRRIKLLEFAWTDVTNTQSIDIDKWGEHFRELQNNPNRRHRKRALSEPILGSLVTPEKSSRAPISLSPQEHKWMNDRLQESVQQIHSLREKLSHLQTSASTGVLRAENKHLQEALVECQQRIFELESQVLRTRHVALDNEAHLQQKLANYHRKVQVAKKEMGKAKAWMTSVVEDLETAQTNKSELEDALCQANASNDSLREQLDDLLAQQYVGSTSNSIKKKNKKGRKMLQFSNVDPQGIEDDDEFEVEVGTGDDEESDSSNDEESQTEDEANKLAEEALYRRSKHILHQLEEERVKVHLAERETWRITKASEEWQSEAMRRREENEALELAKIQMEQDNVLAQSSLRTDLKNLTRFNADLKAQVDELRTEQEKHEKNEQTLRRDFELKMKVGEDRFASVQKELFQAQEHIERLDAANSALISQEKVWKASLEEYREAVNKLQAEKTGLESNPKSFGPIDLEDLQNSSLRAEVEELRIKLQDNEDNFVYHQREWKASLEASREAFQKLEQTNSRLKEESVAAHEKNGNLKAAEGALKQEIQSLQSHNSSLQVQVDNLRSKLRESERLFSVYEDQWQASLTKSQVENNSLAEGTNDLDASGKGDETDRKMTAQEQLYKIFLEESKETVSKLEDEKAMLEQEIVAMRGNNGAVQKTQATLRETLLDLQNSRAQLQGQVENLWTKQGERELKYLAQELELKAALEKSLQAFRRLEFEKAVFEGQVKDLRGKNSLLQSTQNNLRQDLEELTSSNTKLRDQMGGLHTISEENELRFKAEKKEWAEEREDLDGTVRRLMEEKTLLEEDVMILDEENEELDATREALQRDVDRLTESNVALQEQVDEFKEERRDAERKYLAREQDLRISVERSRSEVDRLEKERATLEEKMAGVKTRTSELQTSHNTLLQSYKRLTTSNTALKEQVDKLRGKLDRRERDLLDRRKEWKALLDESKDALRETREDRGFLKEEVLRLKAENKALGTSQSTLQQDLQDARGMNADLSGKVEKAAAKLEESEKKFAEHQTSWSASLEESRGKINQLESAKALLEYEINKSSSKEETEADPVQGTASSSDAGLQQQVEELQLKLEEQVVQSQKAEEEHLLKTSEDEKRYNELAGEHAETQSDIQSLATANARLKSKERDLIASLEEAYKAMGKLEVESAHFKEQMMISRRVEADLEEQNEKLKKEIEGLRASQVPATEDPEQAREKRKNAARCIRDLNTILGGGLLLQLDRDEGREGLEYESIFPDEEEDQDDCSRAAAD